MNETRIWSISDMDITRYISMDKDGQLYNVLVSMEVREMPCPDSYFDSSITTVWYVVAVVNWGNKAIRTHTLDDVALLMVMCCGLTEQDAANVMYAAKKAMEDVPQPPVDYQWRRQVDIID